MNAKHIQQLAAALLTAATMAAYAQAPQAERQTVEREATKARMTDGKALFEEKCANVAGEKIYKTVPDVEGLLLLKVRPQAGEREWADRMWPGAAFAVEPTGEGFLNTFLGAEIPLGHPPGSPYFGKPPSEEMRGSITPRASKDLRSIDRPGYRYVDVLDEKDGKRYRYSGRWDEPWQTDKSYLKGYIKFYLDKTPAPDPAPRYAVTYEDHVVPEERALWLASSTVKVIDRQTNEVLGEMTRYAWSAGAPTSANPSPWLSAYACPKSKGLSGYATRMFVDQVLIPKGDQ
ncbi:MAG: hypothetical protein IPH39_17575 [Sulfuritalea sp.]|nr:hypothetical protein [Sulfuritalea sp.]MBK9350120.1 hypothetical protein [Sulfuritalea sp.]